MDTAVVGLIGGASGAPSVVLLTHYFTQHRESDRHAREPETVTVTVTVAFDADRTTVPVLARTVTNAGFPTTAKTHGG